jgi:hypothetical protein
MYMNETFENDGQEKNAIDNGNLQLKWLSKFKRRKLNDIRFNIFFEGNV